jgi:hypothetical protein
VAQIKSFCHTKRGVLIWVNAACVSESAGQSGSVKTDWCSITIEKYVENPVSSTSLVSSQSNV